MAKPGINPIGPATRMGQFAPSIPLANDVIGWLTEKDPIDGSVRWMVWAGRWRPG